MSGPLMKAVWDRGPADHNQFVVLLTLARFANDDGESCWPTVATIAAKARICERNVKSAIKALPTDGWITVMRKSQDPTWVAAGLKDKKGNSYRVCLSRLGEANPGAPHAPETIESGAPHALESSAPHAPEIKSQVQNPSKSGAESVKPPDPLNSVTTKNQYIPPARTEQKPESDPRHAPVWRFISDCYRKKNRDAQGRPLNPPDIPKCNGVLRDFLLKCDWPTDELRNCITNRFDSDRPPASESPHRWIPQLTTWRNGALNEFGTLKARGAPSNGIANGHAKPSGAQQAAEEYSRLKESQQKLTVMDRKAVANG